MNDQIVSLENLEMIRAVLSRVSTVLEAKDIVQSETHGLPRPQYSDLTVTVAECGSRVEGLIAEFLLAKHLAEQGDLSSGDSQPEQGEEQEEEDHDHTGDPSTEGEQLQLFDPTSYENPPAVTQGMKKYRLLDE